MINRFILLLCLIGISLSTSIAQTNAIADKQYATGDYLLALQNYLKKDKGVQYNYETSLQIARCYTKLGLSDKAYKWYKRAKSIHSTSFDQSLEIGKAAMREGDYSYASKMFTEYAFVNPNVSNHYRSMVTNARTLMNNDAIVLPIETTTYNTTGNDFGVFEVSDEIFFNTDVKSVPLSQEASTTLQDQACTIACDENRKPLLKGLFTKTNIAPISLATENHKVAYASYQSKCQSFMTRREANTLYIGTYVDGKITNVQPFPYNQIGVSVTDPFLTEDGMTLYFAANYTDGYGGFDLYKSSFENGRWNTPENLGEEINTPGDEITPNLDDQGNLYFASDYHFGLGGFDIFRAQFYLDGWINPVNQGVGVNSTNDDYYPFITNNTLYFTSNRPTSMGGEDIYKAILPTRSINVAFQNEAVISTTVSQKEEEVAAIPEAIFIGEYTPRKTNQSIAKLINKNPQPLSMRWSFDMDYISVPNVNYVPMDEIAEVEVPPAFKIPNFESNKIESNSTLVSYEGARLVSIGQVIEKPIESVYFIQLAAFYSSKGDMSTYEKLSSFGNIYKVFTGSAVKVRLGYFYDHTDASQVLSRVISMGYKDAFLVNDELNTANMELVYSNFSSNVTTTSEPKGQTTTTQPDEEDNNFGYTKPIDVPAGKEYKIRLASYEDPIWFEYSKVKDLGQLEQWSKGSWTIFILSGYKTYEEAEQARIQAVNRGYADAEVVIDNQGIIERIKKN